jgi:hypothetical protein
LDAGKISNNIDFLSLLSGKNLNPKDFNIIAALQLLALCVNLLTTNVFAALQLNFSGRAALIFVEILIICQTKPQRGDNIKIIRKDNAFDLSNIF